MTITAADMSDKLYSVDTVRDILASTEPLNPLAVTVDSGVRWNLEAGWNHNADQKNDNDVVSATLSVGGQDYQLTKESLLEATSACGIPRSYALQAPGKLIEPHLNYWYGETTKGDDYKALTVGDRVIGMTKSGITPFSNIRFMDSALASIQARYGTGEVFVDKKFVHTLRSTRLRLVVPESLRVMDRTGTDNDTWSAGLQIKNSLIGAEGTELTGYLFRWTCTNGMIDIHNTSGAWSRRAGQGDEVYDWARASVDEVLGGLEHSLDAVQALVDIPVGGDTSLVLSDLFEQHSVPVPQRNAIIEEMVNTNRLDMYHVLNAVTAAANNDKLSVANVDRLLSIGGAITHDAHERCGSCRRLLPQ